jgi:hypothetical protein
VKASQELVYKFNLEPVGYGNTLPERRRDRDDVKWVLRSAQPAGRSSRSTKAIRLSLQLTQQKSLLRGLMMHPTMETARSDPPIRKRMIENQTRGVVETYFASNSYGASYPGLNFAFATPVSDNIELIFSGQTGLGDAPQRMEATTRIRVGSRHRVGVTAAGLNLCCARLTNIVNEHDALRGQVSLRAVDEWIVRDGIVIVMGLDYSRFIGGRRRACVDAAVRCSVRRQCAYEGESSFRVRRRRRRNSERRDV